MFDNQIDVAKIMREIKESVGIGEEGEEKGRSFTRYKTDALNGIVNEYVRIESFITNTLTKNHEYINVYQSNIPSYNRFGRVLGKAFRFIAKGIRKCTEYLFKNQIMVNQSMEACIKALTESQMQLVKAFDYIDDLYEEKRSLTKELDNKKKFTNSNMGEIYCDFENKYRGNEAIIKERLKYYIDQIIIPEYLGKQELQILDLGCGRGEWLELLKECGYSASGIDINTAMVSTCRKKGLNVVEGEVLEYIKLIPDNSRDIVTAFQVIEHIEIDKIDILLKEIYRILKPNGLVILETPNAANVEVGCYAFYLDPTHVKPVNSELLKFIAERSGYTKVEIQYWKNKEIEDWWMNILKENNGKLLDSPLFRTIVETIKNNFYVSPDFALVAKK